MYVKKITQYLVDRALTDGREKWYHGIVLRDIGKRQNGPKIILGGIAILEGFTNVTDH